MSVALSQRKGEQSSRCRFPLHNELYAKADIRSHLIKFATDLSSKRMRRRFVVATGSPAARRLGLRIVISFPILSKYFQPFVPYLSNPRTLFSRELFRRFPVVPVVVLARARLLPESSGFLAGLVVAQFKDVRASGNTALSSPCWDRSHHEPSG
ncbi:hypothetical protein F511_21899 [Dorcoceras hygrometricum]|uniref:Uncharacterized protein n=1 Tax=Dorcoceras hygrometricum TaxID=472368 RepID=A0A2Z7BE97_9LAMI|nr:hypothetical protein F511_21899 [Dorcoceras hygrometricum]